MTRNVTVDKDACISCQLCADSLPGIFRMDDKGLAEVYASDGTPEELIQEMIDACPTACIHWVNP